MEGYYELYDSETAELLTATDLAISDDAYDSLILESLGCPEVEGHIRPEILGRRRIYAA